MAVLQKIVPCLWFDDQAEAAAAFYVSIFPDSNIVRVLHYTKAGFEIHGKPAGSVLTVEFEIAGQRLTALNGGPQFKFSEAISFEVYCETQPEIDYYWEKLSVGGEQGQCGWLKDRYGLSWQITPIELGDMLADPDPAKCMRVTDTMLQMGKLDLAQLRKVYEAG